MNSIDRVHSNKKKKMETCTFKLNSKYLSENLEFYYQLDTGGGATCRRLVRLVNVHISFMLFCFPFINACLVLLIVPRSKLVRSYINYNISRDC